MLHCREYKPFYHNETSEGSRYSTGNRFEYMVAPNPGSVSTNGAKPIYVHADNRTYVLGSDGDVYYFVLNGTLNPRWGKLANE